MPTTASERAALRAANTFQYDFQPVKDIFGGHRKVTIAPSILVEMDEERRFELRCQELDSAAAAYFETIQHLSPLQRWETMHDWTVDVGDELEIYDPARMDVFECFCTKVVGDSVWIQRHDRNFSELADLACLQPLTDEFGFEEF